MSVIDIPRSAATPVSPGGPQALRGLGRPRRAVYVVLSRSSTVPSRLIGVVTGDRLTHAALALDPGLEYMFGFGRRSPANPLSGCFRRERLDDPLYERLGSLPGLVLEVPVTPVQHDAIRAQVEAFLLDGHRYRYNFAGLLDHVTGRTREDAYRFFCSEFVYHVLYQAGVCDLRVPRGQVRPQTLLSLPGRVVFDGDLLRYRTRDRSLMPS
ncbi:hypothetical protein [Myceligenerans salitolerans]|uniref:Permuted papain-like amidase enzyme, YaeF/YiiX, C92 family n=1 Tax=Myceligenerans salitolerans TaxID=1230528 RepID=A0ABS3IC46_9MICO|nr:hypothetical protein [Myceligenerans salitolerans]MBO0610508.1 hypothetical protein [Myceligenerans salitolerans]